MSRYYVQQSVPQQGAGAGFCARMKALAILPSTCDDSASTSRPPAARNVRASSRLYSRHGSTETSAKPAAVSLSWYSRSCRAPATQPDPQFHVPAHLARHLAVHHHVRDREPSAWLEHAKGFAQRRVLVGRQVDDAVRDDDVHGVVGEWNRLDRALEELHVGDARLALILAGERQHLVGHVETIHLPGRARPGAPRAARRCRRPTRGRARSGRARAWPAPSGLPHPSDTATAASGSEPVSSSE